MRIALIAPYDLSVHGGIGTHIRAQARALRALGHTVTIFGPASAALGDDEVALSGSTVVNFGGTASGAALDPRVFRRAAAALRGAFDVVHVHEPLMPLLPWAAVWSATAPVVGTFHVHRESGHRWYPLARPLLQQLVRRLSARIAVSEAARQTASQYFPGPYDIVPNGIELQRFQTSRARPAGFPPTENIVLYVGRLEPRKGVATLIDAMASVQSSIDDVTLVIVGDGPDAGALRARAEHAQVRAIFVRDVADEDLPAYYQAARVACAPATGGESFGLVLIEALASGTPVVASRIDGYVAAAAESPCVRWVAPGDAAALATELRAVLGHRLASSRDDAVRFASRYDWSQIALRLIAVYARVQGSTAAVRAPQR